MIQILAITGPIYLSVLAGYSLTRLGLFSSADMRVFGRYVVNLALPALMFSSVAQRRIAEILNPQYLLAYLAASLVVLSLGYLFSRRVQGLSATASTFHAMGMSCSNSGFIGFPILSMLFPGIAGVALAMNMLVENLVVLPILFIMADRRQVEGQGWGEALLGSLRRLARNPMVVAMFVGALVSVSGVKPPDVVTRTVGLVAASSAALSLFVVGGSLVGHSLRGLLPNISPILVGKLLVFPALVFIALQILAMTGMAPLSPQLAAAAIIMSAAPMLSIYPILAQAHGYEANSAAAMLAATILSFFTLTALIWLLGVSHPIM